MPVVANVVEMLEMNDELMDACNECPQYRREWFDDRDILLQKVTWERFCRTWLQEDTLWRMGYSEGLSEETLQFMESARVVYGSLLDEDEDEDDQDNEQDDADDD